MINQTNIKEDISSNNKEEKGTTKNKIREIISHNLRNVRVARGYSQIEIGNVLGVTFQQIQKYEKGFNRISAEDLYTLASFYNIPTSYFLNDNKVKEEDEIYNLDADVIRIVRQYRKIQNKEIKRKIMQFILALNDAQY